MRFFLGVIAGISIAVMTWFGLRIIGASEDAKMVKDILHNQAEMYRRLIKDSIHGQ